MLDFVEFFLRAMREYGDFQRSGRPEHLDRAIAVLDDLLSTDLPLRAAAAINVAGMLLVRTSLRRDPADLHRASELLAEAVPAATGTGLEGAAEGQLCAVGVARYEHDGDPEQLSAAIQHGERAVRLGAEAAEPRADLPSHLVTLGHAYRLRAGDADLDRAISLYHGAVRMTQPGAPAWWDRVTNLGATLIDRYRAGGAESDLITAEQILRGAVPAGATGPAMAAALGNLAGGLLTRWDRTGDLHALDRAVDLYERAAEAASPGTVLRVAALSNLAAALGSRRPYRHRGDDTAAILAHLRTAWHEAPPGPEQQACAVNLAHALRLHGRPGEAAEILRGAGATDAGTRAELARTLLDLADPAAAEALFRQVLEALPTGAPARIGALTDLGITLAGRGRGDEAREWLREACETGLDADTPAVLRAAQAWGRWAQSRGATSEAAEAYGRGITAAHRLFRTQITRSNRESWLRLTGDLHLRAAAMRLAGPDRDRRAAVATLDGGRALLLGEELGNADVALDRLAAAGREDLVVRYRRAAIAVRRLTGPAGPTGMARMAAR